MFWPKKHFFWPQNHYFWPNKHFKIIPKKFCNIKKIVIVNFWITAFFQRFRLAKVGIGRCVVQIHCQRYNFQVSTTLHMRATRQFVILTPLLGRNTTWTFWLVWLELYFTNGKIYFTIGKIYFTIGEIFFTNGKYILPLVK